MEENNKSVFETLNKINVNGMTEKKKQTNGTTLTYLSWASAYQLAKANFNDLSYEVERNPETGLPYWYDPLTGYMVFTKVTINGVTHEMWLPVLDATNHAMKSEPYEVKTKYKTYTVPAASMADINRSIMRCLTKCLGMHGLGLYLYQGEDLPSDATQHSVPIQAQPAQPVKPVEKAVQKPATQTQAPARDTRPVTAQMVDFIKKIIAECGLTEEFICSKYKASKLEELKVYQAKHIKRNLDRLKQMFDNERREDLAAIVKNSKPKDMETTFGDAIAPPQPQKQEKAEGKIDLESLGLTEADLNILAEAGDVFS